MDYLLDIGLTNQDNTSHEYRSQNQIIEQFNRTLKFTYLSPKGKFANSFCAYKSITKLILIEP